MTPTFTYEHGDHGALQSIAINGGTIATGSQDGTIQRWDLHDWHPIGGPMQADDAAVWRLAFSPDGHRIAAAGASDDVWLWNPADASRVAIPHHDGVWTVAFNETGDRLATGGIDDAAWVWDVSTDNVVGFPLTANHDDVKGVAFLGNDVVTVGDDRTMRIWDGRFLLVGDEIRRGPRRRPGVPRPPDRDRERERHGPGVG